MKSHAKALLKAKNLEKTRKTPTSKVLNLLKGNEGNVGKNDARPKMPNKFMKYQGAKNEDSENDN
jgi:hypothetical protein